MQLFDQGGLIVPTNSYASEIDGLERLLLARSRYLPGVPSKRSELAQRVCQCVNEMNRMMRVYRR